MVKDFFFLDQTKEYFLNLLVSTRVWSSYTVFHCRWELHGVFKPQAADLPRFFFFLSPPQIPTSLALQQSELQLRDGGQRFKQTRPATSNESESRSYVTLHPRATAATSAFMEVPWSSGAISHSSTRTRPLSRSRVGVTTFRASN